MKLSNVHQDSQPMCKQILNVLSKSLVRRGTVLSLALPLTFVLPVTLPTFASETSTVDKVSATKQSSWRRRRRPRISRPAPPRRRPQNRVQPGGGLDIAAQACLPESSPLTALVPVENPVFTMRDHPTFLFYLSDAPEAVDYAEFILLSSDEKEEIHSVRFSPTASGIVSVSLPAEAEKALEPGAAYHWYLNLHCATSAGVPSVNGWVERLAADDVGGVSVDSALPDVWYDAIAQSAEMLQQSPVGSDTAQAQWSSLLTAAGLDELIDVPVLGSIFSGEVVVSQVGDE